MTRASHSKSDLRRTARAKRAAAAKAAPRNVRALFARQFLGAIPVKAGAVVAGYAATGTEADPHAILSALERRGHAIALPAVRGAAMPLAFRAWHHPQRHVTGAFGIREPHGGARALVPDVLIVPMTAFDRDGHRLGQGGGFYDRTLKLLRRRKPILAVGLAYAAQESLAVEVHDELLDWIVTEREAIFVRRKR
jgi:5-formyltetrahydrofolate cyclo-ligase